MAIATKRSAGVKYGKKVSDKEAKKGITLESKNAQKLPDFGAAGRGEFAFDPNYKSPEATDPGPAPIGVGDREEGESDESLASRIRSQSFSTAGGPTVLSNASIIESGIPQMNAKVNSFQQFSGPGAFGDVTENEAGTFGDEYDIEEILGIDKKKKKKKDAWASLRERQNTSKEGVEYDPYTEAQMKLLAQMQKTSDKRTSEDISRISSSMGRLRADQEAANASGLASIKQVLNLGGSSRYAPISSQGTVGAAINSGIRAIADINSREEELISQARRAQEDNDYQLLGQKLSLIENVRREKAAATAELETTARDAVRQSSRDNAIAGLVQQGITDPVKVLDFLNFDQQGNQIGDFTIAEVTKAMKSLNDVGGSGINSLYKLDNKAIGLMLGAGWTGPDIQAFQNDLATGASVQDILEGITDPGMKAAAMEGLGVSTPTNVRPGAGATDSVTEQAIRTRLFPKAAAILNKGTLSDADRKIIDERIATFRDAGMSEQQILDIFSGWSADVSTPYNNSFRDILLTNLPQEQVSQNLTSLGSLLANKNYQGAMQKIENIGMDAAKKADEEGFFGSTAANTYTKRIDRIKTLLNRSGVLDSVGFIEGNFNKVLGRIKGKDATEIKAELTQLYNTFRKENSGVAVTPSETAFLSNLFADINDPEGNFMAKLDVFQNGLLDQYNSTRRTGGLPEVKVRDILDPSSKLQLYSTDIYLPASGGLDF